MSSVVEVKPSQDRGEVILINNSSKSGLPSNIQPIKVYCCKYAGCNYKTIRPGHIRRHERIHTKEKPFKCQYCDYCASRSDHLKRHMKVHQKYIAYEERAKCVPVPIIQQTVYPKQMYYEPRPVYDNVLQPYYYYPNQYEYNVPLQNDAELFLSFVKQCQQ
ncbi:hypothetical protein WA158_003935 [Blastocystis sp. Blastoise]